MAEYPTHRMKLHYKLPPRYRARAALRRAWRRVRPQVRVLRSQHFEARPKKWWKPSDRKAARVGLAVMEHNIDDFRREMQRKMSNFLLYGTEEGRK